MNRYFPSVIGSPKNNMSLSLAELDEFVSDLVFPIHDESAQKILKFQMDEIMGVYLEPEALYQKTIKKNNLKLGHVIDMV